MTELSATARVRIHRPVAEVFEAFSDPALMTRFWFPRATGRLETGRQVAWFVGTTQDAPEITIRVKAAQKPHFLHIEWGDGDQFTDVTWDFKSDGAEATILHIRETGFPGTADDKLHAALASTGGFNQVAIAAKALLEHGVEINIVKDHAS